MRRICLFLCVSLMLISTSTAWSQLVRGPQQVKVEPVHTVRYSYEKWSRVKPARYVLVPRTTRVKPSDIKDRIRTLFRDLRASKNGSYGPKSAIAFNKDFETTKAVYVYLDMGKRQYFPIVMAETVYTFTENGASKVIFPKGPGTSAQGWTRANIPQPAYALTIPFWQTLPPAEILGALAQMPDGSLLPSDIALKRLKSGDQALSEALWTYTETGGAAALAAVKAASTLGVADLADRLIPLLQSADRKLRLAAIQGLKGKDSATVNRGLRSVVDGDPEVELRDIAAGILASSSNPEFSAAAQYHALKSKDPALVLAAAKALGESTQKEAKDALLSIIQHEDSRVREASMRSLVKRGDTSALVDRLAGGKLSKDVATELARLLVGEKDKSAHQEALMYLAVSGSGDDATKAASQLAQYKNGRSISSLGKALKHSDGDTRIAAAGALAQLGDIKALKLLANADVHHEESGPAVMAAITKIYANQSLKTVLKATREKNQVLKRSAVATLGILVKKGGGKRNRRAILEALRPLSKTKDPLIRAATARSFEVMAGDDVRADVIKLAADKDIEVRRAAAHALRSFPAAETNALLLQFVKDSDPVILAHAAESIGILMVKDGRDTVIDLMSHTDVRVRRAATATIVKLGSEIAKRALLRLLSERLFDSDGKVRLYAIKGLHLVKDEKTVTVLGALIQDPMVDVRLATLEAMANTGHASAVDGISGALEDDNKVIRKAAIEALAGLKRKEAIPVLQGYLTKETDKSLVDQTKKVIRSLN
jgi:HEAT repeat protein